MRRATVGLMFVAACSPAAGPESATVDVHASASSSGGLAPPVERPHVGAIAAGPTATCALSSDGTARCWGTVMTQAAPEAEDSVAPPARGEAPFDLAGLADARAVGLGTSFGCALRADSRVLCFGNLPWGNGEGVAPSLAPRTLQGGMDLTSISVGPTNACAVTKKGRVRCWGTGDVLLHSADTHDAGEPAYVEGIADIVEVAVGARHACARTSAGGVVCWGENKRGQLGDGGRGARARPVSVRDLPAKVTALAAGGASDEGLGRRLLGDFTCALLENGAVVCWGSNESGQLGVSTTDWRASAETVPSVTSAVAITAGTQHACALGKGGEVTCWGRNDEGQIASSIRASRTEPTRISGLDGPAAAVAAGGHHTCAVTKADAIYCWGQNTHGERGDPGGKSAGPPHLVKDALRR